MDTDALFNHARNAASERIEASGYLRQFAVGQLLTGEIFESSENATSDLDFEKDFPQEYMRRMCLSLYELACGVRVIATAVIFQVKVKWPEPLGLCDGIQIQIDCEDDLPIAAIIPYQIEVGRLELFAPRWMGGVRTTFQHGRFFGEDSQTSD